MKPSELDKANGEYKSLSMNEQIELQQQLEQAQARIATDKKQIVDAAELLRETFDAHADRDSGDYNECEKGMCQWCEEAKVVIDYAEFIKDKTPSQSLVEIEKSRIEGDI